MRFNLRALLLAVTVFAVWLGLHMQRTRTQERAVREIHAHHGWVAYDYQFSKRGFEPDIESPIPAWLRLRLGDDFFHSVREVGFRLQGDEQNVVLPLDSLLAGVPDTKRLRLWGKQVTDENLQAVARLSNLDHLFITNGANVSDAGLIHLKKLDQLVFLYLTGTQITDDGIMDLQSLPNLQFLNVTDTQVTTEGAERFMSSCPNCIIQL